MTKALKRKSSSRRSLLLRAQNQAGLSNRNIMSTSSDSSSSSQDENNIKFAQPHHPHRQHHHSHNDNEKEEEVVVVEDGIYEEYLHSLIIQQEEAEYKTAKCRRDSILVCFVISALSCLIFALVVTVQQKNAPVKFSGSGSSGVVSEGVESGVVEKKEEEEEKKVWKKREPSIWLDDSMDNEEQTEIPQISKEEEEEGKEVVAMKHKPSIWLDENTLEPPPQQQQQVVSSSISYTTTMINLYEDCSYEALSASTDTTTDTEQYQTCLDVCSPFLCCFEDVKCTDESIQEQCEVYKDCQGLYLFLSGQEEGET